MTIHVDIRAASKKWRSLPRARALAREAVEACVAHAGVELADGAELCLTLADDAEIQRLNARWRRIDKPTNVLSFPAAPPERLRQALLIGDVIVAYETMRREASSEGKTPADHFRHLVVHGVLHLFGHDHQSEAEAERMEALERMILASLGVADPYALESAPAR